MTLLGKDTPILIKIKVEEEEMASSDLWEEDNLTRATEAMQEDMVDMVEIMAMEEASNLTEGKEAFMNSRVKDTHFHDRHKSLKPFDYILYHILRPWIANFAFELFLSLQIFKRKMFLL